MQTITITHEHLAEARAATNARSSNRSTLDVCLLAIAARHVDPTVESVGVLSIRFNDGRIWYATEVYSDMLHKFTTAFDRGHDADVAAMLPFTYEVTEV